MYHLVWISPEDEWKTAFQTHYGSFKWFLMPEGLTNSPAAFQRFMNVTFMDMIDIIVIIYLDEILIYSNNISEHKAHIWEVLNRLHANGLFANADKCNFHVTLLGVNALHYSTRNWEGFWTLASACALCLTTHYSCPSISGAYWKF